MVSYKTYQSYKPTKYDWLESIPTGWNVRRLKEVGGLIGGAGFPHEFQNIQGEELYFYKVGDLSISKDGKTLLKAPHSISKDTAKALRASIIPNNAIVYAKIGAALLLNRRRLTISNCCIDNNMTAYITNEEIVLPKFALFWLSTIDFGEHVNPGAVPSLSEGYQSVLPIPVPPLEEQKKIADFLDYQTSRIDALITKKEDLLLKLQEKRSALITQAVTKGIDPNTPTKPSGVEWLGAVPAHWNIKRLKFTVNLISDKIEAESSDLEYMGLEHIESWTGKRIEDEKAFSEGTASKFLKDDVLFGKLRPYLAKVYLANHSGLVSTEALVLRSKKEMHGGFIRYYMATRDFIDIVNSSTFGSKMPRANWDFIGNLLMLLPDYDEQVSIANFIESKLSQLDAQKKKVEDVIAKLQEYRAALITNAVTGKIDVRSFVVPDKG